jgi:hypothetical protein
MKTAYAFFAAILISSFAVASTYNPLSGSYRIAGKDFYDPPENQPQNTHVYFFLEGRSAKDLYQTMKVKPILDVCGAEGIRTKLIGEMQCSFYSDSKSYACWFGIDVKNQKITSAVVC